MKKIITMLFVVSLLTGPLYARNSFNLDEIPEREQLRYGIMEVIKVLNEFKGVYDSMSPSMQRRIKAEQADLYALIAKLHEVTRL